MANPRGQHFNTLLQIRYGRAERRTPLGPFNAAIDPNRRILPAPDLEFHRRAHTGPMLSQQKLGEIRWYDAVQNSQRNRSDKTT